MASVLILMATFNGIKYISEQIYSIESQTNRDWEIIIADDNSSDSTLDVIYEFQQRDARVKYVIRNSENVGPFRNFMNLLAIAYENRNNYQFFAFSDQDDFWEPEKLETIVSNFKELGTSPRVIISDASIINCGGEIEHESLNSIRGLCQTNSGTPLFAHIYYGCLMMFNYELISLLPDLTKISPGYYFAHDAFIVKCAYLLGDISFIDNKLVRYRRHGSNVSRIGGMMPQTNLSNLKEKCSIRNVVRYLKKLRRDSAGPLTHTSSVAELLNSTKAEIKAPVSLEQIETSIATGGVRLLRLMVRMRVNRISIAQKIRLYTTPFVGYQKYFPVEEYRCRYLGGNQ
ncbi:MAG: glycosyltransferase [Propionibacteriaceae bacterium]|jgi:rhamnosyltransferase|nr:glycosyltransferase [Propionibacteriaceae bacterium]